MLSIVRQKNGEVVEAALNRRIERHRENCRDGQDCPWELLEQTIFRCLAAAAGNKE